MKMVDLISPITQIPKENCENSNGKKNKLLTHSCQGRTGLKDQIDTRMNGIATGCLDEFGCILPGCPSANAGSWTEPRSRWSETDSQPSGKHEKACWIRRVRDLRCDCNTIRARRKKGSQHTDARRFCRTKKLPRRHGDALCFQASFSSFQSKFAHNVAPQEGFAEGYYSG